MLKNIMLGRLPFHQFMIKSKYILVMDISRSEISISKRELEVLKLLAEGYTSKQIGYLLQIAENTVITYRERLKEKFACKNCPELIYKAAKLSLI